MPFTGAHPLAVLPFLRTSLPPSALVVGSVVPDLPLFVPFRVPFDAVVRGHTPWGLLTVDLPLGVLLWVLWHALLAPAAYGAAPAALRVRLTEHHRPGLRRRWPGSWRMPVALVLGAATHVLWDEFTHAGRWGTEHLPALARDWGPLPGYRWLQYASGVLGAAALLVWLVRWWRRAPRTPLPARPAVWPAWVAIAGAGLVTGVAGALAAPDIRKAAWLGATWGGGAALAAAALLAVIWHVRSRGN